MTVSKARGAKAKCDRLASQITRSVGVCQGCGSTESLQCCHIISRRYSHTRTDLSNLICGCAGCHRRWTDHPVEFADFVREQIGEAKYQELYLKSQRRTKFDWTVELERLQVLHTEGVPMNLDWMDSAACKGWPTDLFFPDAIGCPTTRIPVEVQRVCSLCPVRVECREFGIATHSGGVWGGESEKGLRRIARRRGRKAA